MATLNTEFYKKKKQTKLYLSALFLLCIIILTAALFLYTKNLESKNTELQAQISQRENSIAEISLDPNVQTYSLYQSNKNLLNKLSYESRVSSFVDHLKKNFLKFGISGKWFSYSNGKVVVAMSAETTDEYAYQKIIRFLNGYRSDEKATFMIEPITNYTWYDEITFEWNYILKPQQ